ncbi:MAG: response regulator transcription factor NblR, partial [Microcystaceae cyanobacterium]
MTFSSRPLTLPFPSIFLVQTDEVLSQKAKLDLQDLGYKPTIIPTIAEVWPELERSQPAMMIFDKKRSGDAGVKLCRKLRQQGYRGTILMIVEQESLEERVACLEAGADDYLLKPYRAESFLQRIRFYLHPSEPSSEQLQFGSLILDLSTRRLLLNGRNIDLTMKEFELLKYLMSQAEQVLTREQILENVWGYDFQGESNIIEVYVRYLRLKIEMQGQKRL